MGKAAFRPEIVPRRRRFEGGLFAPGVALGLAVLCLAVRLPGLLKLPIFGDEAIYLRWAQLVRQGYIWISDCDPKPPLHFWLIAAVMNWTADPLWAARLISVVTGAAAIPLVMWICGECLKLSGAGDKGKAAGVGIIAAVLMIFCPFVAFYQRFATADGLFTTEMLLSVWLSLRWARRIAGNERAWAGAIFLGLSLGAALLTRQGLSYVLCLMPGVALLLHLLRHRRDSGGVAGGVLVWRGVGQLCVAALLALLVWAPYLFADLKRSAVAKEQTVAAELRERIFYKSHFTDTQMPRGEMISRNFEAVFIPAWLPSKGGAAAMPTGGWFYFYLTPPVFFAGLIGMGYLAVRRGEGRWRLFAFIAAWMVLMLGPTIFLGSVVYSRYVLAAVPPLLIAAAIFLSDLFAFIVARKVPRLIVWLLCGVIGAEMLFGPMLEIAAQISAPDRQTLTLRDRNQYITGWTAGGPTMEAIAALNGLAATRPIVVITASGWGTPADAAWVYLSNNHNITMYYKDISADGPVILSPAGAPGSYLLRKNKYLFTKPEAVVIPTEAAVYFIVNDPLYAGNVTVPTEAFFRQFNPDLGAGRAFYGVEGEGGSDHVVVFAVR